MKFYSIAAAGVEPRDPDEIKEIEVDSAEPEPAQPSAGLSKPYTFIMWSGNGYSDRRAWFACENEYIIDLEKAR